MENHEMTSDFSYLAMYSGCSAIATVLIFKCISPMLSRTLTTTYSKLTIHQQTEWDGRVISNVHTLISNILTIYSLVFVKGMSDDPIWYDCSAARITVSITIGYMLADLVCMLLWCTISTGELLSFLGHHAATSFAYYFVSVYGVLCWFAMFRILCELSNYCMNQRWYFDVIGVARTDWRVMLNGFMFLITFFLCRIFTMPFFWYTVYCYLQLDTAMPLGHIRYTVMIFPSVILDSLNLYWFYKIIVGFRKALRKRPHEKKST